MQTPFSILFVRLLLLVSGSLALTSCASHPRAPIQPTQIVETQSGLVAGKRTGNVNTFKGIPYAKPPVGDLRWAPPEPVQWEGTYQADTFGPACLQVVNSDGTPNYGGYSGPVSEDCLYLNIWMPDSAHNAPVMVWLYGGGGVVGASNVPTYDGTSFARDGVILVSLNYRHGSLAGFAHPSLTTNSGTVKTGSNFHLQDTIAALEWVQHSINAFGGDPDNVTLFGESAGATMTANLVTSPKAKGLFSKAIFESTGSLATPGTPLEKAEQLGATIATAFGLPGADASLEDLRRIDGPTLIGNRKLGFGLRTIIDGIVKEQSILESFKSGTQNQVLLMVGTNSDEGRLFGTRKIAKLAEKRGPVFHYFFDYVPSALREEHPNGAPHAGELPFVFDTLETYAATKDAVSVEDQKVADLVHSCWVSFAKLEGHADTLDCNGFNWPARTEGNGAPVAVLSLTPEISSSDQLKSPPNGAPPGPTSRDDY